jgi:hypothetical protein
MWNTPKRYFGGGRHEPSEERRIDLVAKLRRDMMHSWERSAGRPVLP